MKRILIINSAARTWRLRTIQPGDLPAGMQFSIDLLSGEALAQFFLMEDPGQLVLARGPMVYLAGNKLTVGYLSPLTGFPHYSFVGGRSFSELFQLGLDAIVFTGAVESTSKPADYLVISGRAPNLRVEWKSASQLPSGQRSAYHWLVKEELRGSGEAGSILCLGEAGRAGFPAANLGCDGIYHAGRGGAGFVFSQFAAGLVLRGDPLPAHEGLAGRYEQLAQIRDEEIQPRVDQYCQRLSRRDGGTIQKMEATGSGISPSLPTRNATSLAYRFTSLGGRKVLERSRDGKTGCQWCQVNCRHWHWVDFEDAPGGRDRFLDDFEPAYAVYAMLDLTPPADDLAAQLRMVEDVDRRIMLPVEQLGMDVIDLGVGLAALFEGLQEGIIDPQEMPEELRHSAYFGNMDAVQAAIDLLRAGSENPIFLALRAGPQGLVEQYPRLKERVFTSGKSSLANPGHCNALWTFLMPFSRFFGHYSGQIYKIEGQLNPGMSLVELRELFERVVSEMLRREYFSCLCNAMSNCAFTFVAYSQDGQGKQLDSSRLLARALQTYGLAVSHEDLQWFGEAFWAQSIAFKLKMGWLPPDAKSLPDRVYEALTQSLGVSQLQLTGWMDGLIDEWKRQTKSILQKYGYIFIDAL
jgi:aldehyde:ferredoxin oxidoreductase